MSESSSIFSQNSKRLKNFFKPLNPLYIADETSRFFFSVNGIKKTWLPLQMKTIPFISQLIKASSLSKFIRSGFFKSNFKSVPHLLSILHQKRLQFDFPYWVACNYPDSIPALNEAKNLVNELQKNVSFKKDKSIRIIIRKNRFQDLSLVIALFTLWQKAFSKKSLNVLFFAPSSRNSNLPPFSFDEVYYKINSSHLKDFFIESSKLKSSPFKFFKTCLSSAIYSPQLDSKFLFCNPANPDSCRGNSFSFLIMNDMHLWTFSHENPDSKIISAAFPVVAFEEDSAIILEGCPGKKNSLLEKEFIAAQKNISTFTPISLPWYQYQHHILKFDFPDEKITFYKRILKYRHRKKFHHFKLVDGRYLYALWQQGVPLETLHWFAVESTYYSTRQQFLSHFPT